MSIALDQTEHPSRHCYFGIGWSDHYLENIVIAMNLWLRDYKSVQGSAVYLQMQEIKQEAETEWRRRSGK